MSDSEIADVALGRCEDTHEDDSYDAGDHKPMHIDDLVELCDKLIIGLEQREFMSELQIMGVYSIKEKLLHQKPLLLKQMTIDEVFKRQNLASQRKKDENNNDTLNCQKTYNCLGHFS